MPISEIDFEAMARAKGWYEMEGTGWFWRQPTRVEQSCNHRCDKARSWEEACWIDNLHPDARPVECVEDDQS